MNTIRKDIEISIYDLLIYVCQRWRSLLVAMIVGAIVLGAFGWYRSGTETIAAGAEESVYTANLSEDDIRTIDTKAKKILNLQKMRDMQEEYIEKSPFMRLNPFAVYVGNLTFSFKAEDNNPAGPTLQDPEIIAENYGALIKSEGFAERLNEVLEPVEGDTGGKVYFYEDVCQTDTSEAPEGKLKVKVIGTTESTVKLMLSAISEYVSSKKEEVVSKSEAHVVSEGIPEIYSSSAESVEVTVGRNTKYNAEGGTTKLSIFQCQQFRLDELSETEENLSAALANVEPFEQPYCNYLIQQYTLGRYTSKKTGEASEEAIANNTSFTRSISIKYVVVGAIAGLILLIIIYVIKYIAEALIRNGNDVVDTYGLSLLAVFEGNSKFYKHHKLKIDEWLRKKRIRSQIIPYEENVDLLATQVYITVSQKNYGKVCVAIGPEVEDGCAFLDAVKAKVKGTAEISVVNNIQAAPDALFDMTTVDGVVLVEQADCSKYRNIDAEVRLCKQYNADVIGVVVVQ